MLHLLELLIQSRRRNLILFVLSALGPGSLIPAVGGEVELDEEEEVGDVDGVAEGVLPPLIKGGAVLRVEVVVGEGGAVDGHDDNELEDLNLRDVALEPDVLGEG